MAAQAVALTLAPALVLVLAAEGVQVPAKEDVAQHAEMLAPNIVNKK